MDIDLAHMSTLHSDHSAMQRSAATASWLRSLPQHNNVETLIDSARSLAGHIGQCVMPYGAGAQDDALVLEQAPCIERYSDAEVRSSSRLSASVFPARIRMSDAHAPGQAQERVGCCAMKMSASAVSCRHTEEVDDAIEDVLAANSSASASARRFPIAACWSATFTPPRTDW
eukprot:CAMPEP_0115862064 /NCGR_PEP_ID=MMETSP0287-20121206/17982_1 /TAXON_ID=412157 /ORGANISM="Chrysochromulina rotalis, Strain UIO044" /LENGTH=171 /DNA_ID=CAMNT_0003316471 /DNA_START=40 /DNA_END=553 /DNA_ORIENTATION=-